MLCLDFANTVDWRDTDHPEEHLNGYSDLVSWSQYAGILTESQAQLCLKQAKLHSRQAEAVLRRAVALREAVHQIFSAIIDDHSPSAPDMGTLNAELSKAMVQVRVEPADGGYSWTYATEGNALDKMLWPIVRSAADLLTSDKLNRIRKCPGQGCGWLFLDMSRNRSRRWCDMKDCGNRAKARRHYQRKRAL